MSHRTSFWPQHPSTLSFRPFTSLVAGVLALGASAFGVACGGSVASTVETDGTSAAQPASVQATATLFAHFADAPSAILMGIDYVYVATKTSVLSGVRSDNGALWAVSKATGERHQLWIDRLGAAPIAIARSGRELVLAMSDGRVITLPERGGESRVVARLDGTPSHLVATGTDAVLRLAENPSLIVSVGLGNGAIRTRFIPDTQVVSLAAEGDTVYVGMKTSSGGRVLRLPNGPSAEERTIEMPTAPCGMAAAPAGLVVSDGTKTLRYWDGASAPSAFVSDLTSTCTLALAQDRVFWAGTSPKTLSGATGKQASGAGGTVLLSRTLGAEASRTTPAKTSDADWMTTDLPAIAQAESDQTNVYVLSADDVVRIARPQ